MPINVPVIVQMFRGVSERVRLLSRRRVAHQRTKRPGGVGRTCHVQRNFGFRVLPKATVSCFSPSSALALTSILLTLSVFSERVKPMHAPSCGTYEQCCTFPQPLPVIPSFRDRPSSAYAFESESESTSSLSTRSSCSPWFLAQQNNCVFSS